MESFKPRKWYQAQSEVQLGQLGMFCLPDISKRLIEFLSLSELLIWYWRSGEEPEP